MAAMPLANAIVRPTGHLTLRRFKIKIPRKYRATARIERPMNSASGFKVKSKRVRFGGAGIGTPTMVIAALNFVGSGAGGWLEESQDPKASATIMIDNSTRINWANLDQLIVFDFAPTRLRRCK